MKEYTPTGYIHRIRDDDRDEDPHEGVLTVRNARTVGTDRQRDILALLGELEVLDTNEIALRLGISNVAAITSMRRLQVKGLVETTGRRGAQNSPSVWRLTP